MKFQTLKMAGILGLALVVGGALADDSGGGELTTTVTSEHSMTVSNANPTLTLTPNGTETQANSSDATVTSLDWLTNEGLTYAVEIAATAWTFTPPTGSSLTADAAVQFPVLTVSDVTLGNFVNAQNPGTWNTLINTDNTAAEKQDLITNIKNEDGDATVALQADISDGSVGGDSAQVVAGDYVTTVTYTFTQQ